MTTALIPTVLNLNKTQRLVTEEHGDILMYYAPALFSALPAPIEQLLINRYKYNLPQRKITLPDQWRFTVQLHKWMVCKFSRSFCFAFYAALSCCHDYAD